MRTLIQEARPSPNSDLGAAVFNLLIDWDHVLRRVETVDLVSEYSVRRRVTIDVDVPTVLDCLSSFLESGAITPARPRPHIYAPVGLLRKDLLVDFDMRDGDGRAIPVLPRVDDSYVALCLIYHAARQLLTDEMMPGIVTKLYSIAYVFPEQDIDVAKLAEGLPDPLPTEWRHDPSWENSSMEVAQWSTLLATTEFRYLLAQFTTNFLLLAPIRSEADVSIVKYAYQSPTERPSWDMLQALALKPAHVQVRTPSAGQGRTYHLRLRAPQGLTARDATWKCADAETTDLSKATARKKLAHFKVHLYVRRLPPTPGMFSVLLLRAPPEGFLTTALFSVLFNFVVLLGSLLAFPYAEDLGDHVDAAVALLLVGPGLFAAYALRRADNPVVARVHRWPRILVGVSLLMPYAAAALLYLQLPNMALLWSFVTGLAGVAGVFLGIMLVCAHVGARRTMATGQRPVAISIEPI